MENAGEWHWIALVDHTFWSLFPIDLVALIQGAADYRHRREQPHALLQALGKVHQLVCVLPDKKPNDKKLI